MPHVRGYRRKDGTWVRAHWRRPVAGAGIAVTVTVGALTLTATGPGGGSSVAKPKPKPASRGRLSNDVIPAVAQAGFKRAEASLVASGHKVSLAVRLDNDCAAYSSGQVHEFFESNPCKWLARAYVQVGYSEVLVAISWVEMPSARLAAEYKKLVDTPDAGSVTELSRNTTLYRKIDYSYSAHTSGINGSTVWNVQARPIVPKTTAEITEILIDSRQQ
jgi:hypothetical protein